MSRIGSSIMRRRTFISLLAVTVVPVAPCAFAQPAKLPTIGVLGVSTASNWSRWTAAFRQRLRELGWVEGRNVAIEYRWADGRGERFGELAADLVHLNANVILTVGSGVDAVKRV